MEPGDPDPERPWDVLDEAALLWTVQEAERVRARHRPSGLGACTVCPTATPWPCVMVAVAERALAMPVGPQPPAPLPPPAPARPSTPRRAVARPGRPTPLRRAGPPPAPVRPVRVVPGPGAVDPDPGSATASPPAHRGGGPGTIGRVTQPPPGLR